MSRLQSLARRFENIRPRPMPGWVFGNCQPQIRTRMKIPANMGTVESSMDQIEQRQALACGIHVLVPSPRRKKGNESVTSLPWLHSDHPPLQLILA